MRANVYFFMMVILGLWSCQNPENKEPIVSTIQTPAALSSEEPNLFTDQRGDVYLSWIEKSEGQAKLLFSKLESGAWSASNMISQGNNWFVNWADFPSFIAQDQLMAAHWLQKRDEGTYDYDVRMVISNNSGQSWNNSFVPHTDGVSAEHGFVSMLPMEGDRIFATWLDGRNTKGGHSGNGAMTLRAAIFDNEGIPQEEWELDDRVCDCCQTSAAMTANGPVVVYRNRTEGEIRDMSIVRLIGDDWTTPQTIHDDQWNIAGCPVNGPAMAASGNDLAIAWFTASGGNPKVKLALSSDAGASFLPAITLSEENTNGRVGIAMLADRSLVVSWMETEGETAKILLGHYTPQGALKEKFTVAESTSSRSSGFPVITNSGNSVYMAWTEVSENNQVKTTRIEF